MIIRLKFSFVLVCSLLCFPRHWGSSAQAGLTASDVAVVINSKSLNSRTVANHFIALRGIPAINVVVLDDVPNSENISVDDFRSKILRPLLTELEQRQLLGHIQCVAYSADFPSSIDISSDLASVPDLPRVYTNQASINSLTYYYAEVLAENPIYIGLESNFYARRQLEAYFSNPGGESTLKIWQQIEQLTVDEKHSAAADALEKLFIEQPHQFPVAYLAAAQAALAEQPKRAIELLRKAIAAGWSSGWYLEQDLRFDSIRDETAFSILLLALEERVQELQPAIGFDTNLAWAPNGVPVRNPAFGLRYLLSTVLAVTRGPGTTLPQAIEALKRSASADFTHPNGTFYFCLTNDVRTTTRQWGFVGALDDLQKMGFQAEVVQDTLPKNKSDVLGLQFGTPSFDWGESKSQFVPGAIADNLTSLGGVMSPNAGQTNLSELIKAGAAGSSGTVTEPFALQEKFPHPQLYVQYARGASLAEAFYLNVTGPYQLLIVGDPLCRPFSYAPQPRVLSEMQVIDASELVELTPEFTGLDYVQWNDSSIPQAKRQSTLAAASIRISLNGTRAKETPALSKLAINLDDRALGYQELRLRFSADDPLSQSSETMVPVWVGPRDLISLNLPAELRTPDASSESPAKISLQSREVKVTVTAARGSRVSLWHHWEQIANTAGSSAEFSVPLSDLGMGPVRLQAKVELEDGMIAQSTPVQLLIEP